MSKNPDPEFELAAMARDPARLRTFARRSAEEVMRTAWGAIRPDLDRYSRAAVVRRAERDVAGDVAAATRLEEEFTEADVATYRRIYVAAFVAAWYDPALRKATEPKGFLIVCMR